MQFKVELNSLCVKVIEEGPTFYQTTANTLPTTYRDLCAVRFSRYESANRAVQEWGDSVLVIVRR